MQQTPSASYSVTLRVEHPNRAEALGEITTAIGQAGGLIGAADVARMQEDTSIRDLTVNARDSEHSQQIADAVDALPEVRVLDISDRTFLIHFGAR